ncbi:MAG TPA: response regulator transcription factor [Niastella sp.]
MNQLKVFIIEDNADDARKLKLQLERRGYIVSGIAAGLQDAINKMTGSETDLFIIDIFLQGTRDGIVFAEKMNAQEIDKRPFIFLTNASDRHTFDLARKTGPFSYLLKPFNELELEYAIELAIEKFANEDGYFATFTQPLSLLSGDVFFVKKGNMLAKILVGDIRYIEVDGKYCKLMYGDEKYLIQKSLKQLQAQLSAKQFIKIHRNYIVNVKEIIKIDLQDHAIILQDGNTLSFSRRYLDALVNQFGVLK